MRANKIIGYRYERFGGVLHLRKPPMLVWVDKEYMRSLGYPDSPLWDEPEQGLLSAPIEVHAMLTARCSAGCRGCYANATPAGSGGDGTTGELDLAGWKRAIDVLAEARVFHIALGGGESMESPILFDVAHYAKDKGIVPNLTTNGFHVDKRAARASRVFGQINVSVDGLGERYNELRGVDGFDRADRALTLLRKARCRFGINTVVSRRNYDDLEPLVRYARKKGVNQVELLRFKPAGRGRAIFREMDLTSEQAKDFYPLLQKLQKKYRVNLRVDCSFTPMVFAHGVDPERAEYFRVAGCHAGRMLMGIQPDGRVNGCSFAKTEPWTVEQLPERWARPDSFADFRAWEREAPAPCANCEYLSLCLGGCHVVAEAIHNDSSRPDPGCPIAAGGSPLGQVER